MKTVTIMRLPALLGIALLMLAMPSVGAPIAGVMNTAGDVRVSNTLIDFLPPVGLSTGDFRLTFTQEGYFVPLANTTGVIKDLSRSTAPAGVSILIPAFMTLNSDPNVRFDLTRIVPGSFPSTDCFAAPAAGQICTPPPDATLGVSPFNLNNTTATSSIVGFTVLGNAVNTITNESTPFIGTFSTQFTDKPFQAVLAIVAQGGSVQASYSANFVMIPEPGTAFAGLGGLLMFGFLARRRFRKG